MILATCLIFMVLLMAMGSIAFKLTRINLMATSNYKTYIKAFYLAAAACSITFSPSMRSLGSFPEM